MTTTNDWLKTADASHLAFSLVFEGYNLVYTTSSDTAGIATAFAGTDWTNVKSGLMLTGTISQEIELFKPRIATNSMSFRIADADGTVRRLLLGNPTTDAVTYAKDDLSANGTSWNVRDTTDFAASGHIYTGSEAIAYSAKAGAPDHGFSGFTRGKWSLWGTSSSDRIGRVHRGQVPRSIEADGPTHTPEIRNSPNVWYNRPVALLLHHNIDGAWSTVTLPMHAANAKVAWAGRIKEWSDSGDGTIEINALSINELLMSTVFADQYEAEAASIASYFVTSQSKMQIEYGAPSGGTVTPYGYNGALSPSTGWANGFYAFDDLMAQIQEQFNLWTADGSIPRSGFGNPWHRWSVELRNTSDGVRVVFEVQCLSGATFPTENTRLHVSLNGAVWNTLGFDRGEGYLISGDAVERLALGRVSSTVFQLVGPRAPRIGIRPDMIRVGDPILVTNESGVWMTQPTMPAEADETSEGYLQVGDKVFNVVRARLNHNGGQATSTAFIVKHAFQAQSPIADGRSDISGTIEDSSEPQRVKQVWCERGPLGELLAKVMLSTGASGYNEPDLDVYGEGFGIGVPYDLVDVSTFLTMENDYELFLEKPTPFKELLEEVCSVYGRHIVLSGGRITLTRPGFDSPEDAESIQTLDEDSKSESPGRPDVRYSTDGIVNRIELVYNSLQISRQKAELNSTAEFTTVSRVSNRVTVVDATSESAYGHRRTLQVSAKGILDPEGHWAEHVAKPIITHFSRPFAIITRSISARGSHIVPGDIIQLTDNYTVDPATGERGSAALACWVRSTEFDWSRGAGRVELVFMPDHDASRMRRFSPAARFSSYNAGTRVTTFEDHAYSRATDPLDASHLEVGDIVQLREISPVNPAAPDVQTDTVFAQSGSTITGTAGWAPIAGRRYVVESVPVTSPSSPATAQRAFAFLADEDDRLINATYPAARWAGSTKSLDAFTISRTYTQQFVKPADSDGAADQPLSSRKLIDAMNNCNVLLAYGTRNVLVNHIQFPTASTSSTSYVMVFGPCWVPLYGSSPNSALRRRIKGKVKTDGNNGLYTATFRLTSSVSPPTGASFASVTFPSSARSSTVQYGPLTTTPEWLDIPAFSPSITIRDGQIGTFLTGELSVSNAAMIQTFDALAVVELELV